MIISLEHQTKSQLEQIDSLIQEKQEILMEKKEMQM